MIRKGADAGFSMIELLLAMTITLGVGLLLFSVFASGERLFRDHGLRLELAQNIRAVAGLIGDELRRAGQGVPLRAAGSSPGATGALETFLEGTGPTSVRFRASLRNVRAIVDAEVPLELRTGAATTLDLDNARPLAEAAGASPARHAFLTAPGPLGWNWVRARIEEIEGRTNRIHLVASESGEDGFVLGPSPTVRLEGAVSYRLDGETVLRGSASGFADPATPILRESRVGDHFTALGFRYFDRAGAQIQPDSPADRLRIREVQVTLAARSAGLLSTGSVATEELSLVVFPRNLQLPDGIRP